MYIELLQNIKLSRKLLRPTHNFFLLFSTTKSIPVYLAFENWPLCVHTIHVLVMLRFSPVIQHVQSGPFQIRKNHIRYDLTEIQSSCKSFHSRVNSLSIYSPSNFQEEFVKSCLNVVLKLFWKLHLLAFVLCGLGRRSILKRVSKFLALALVSFST